MGRKQTLKAESRTSSTLLIVVTTNKEKEKFGFNFYVAKLRRKIIIEAMKGDNPDIKSNSK